jgi:peptidoglycan/xylan/chitin deacetylase (PgdA/CDA1 family)
MKQLIPLGALLLSAVACGSDGQEPAAPSVGGSANSQAGSPPSGGSGGGGAPSSGGSGGSPSAAGSGVGGASGGQAPTGGAGASGGGGAGSVGGAGGASGGAGGAGGASGGTGGSGGSGPSASFKCDNLSLAPSKTGVAKPSGAAGGLKVLDWAGFKGAASFTFDDNTPSQMPNYPALKATGGHVTWFVVSNWLMNNSGDVAKFKATMADGHEVANHTKTHQSAASANDLQDAQSFIKTNFGVDAHSMAAPNCADGWASVAPNVLFQNRGPCGGGVATISPRDTTSPYRLPAYLPATNEAASKMSAAIQAGKWRIFVLHGFDSQGGTYQPVPIANVTGAMSQAVTDGYWVEGMTNVGAYWQGQKLVPESATTSAKWTLPEKFPPNMCLRITTTGGTVTQKGETIPWNDHGYYQISLDAGEVTIN